MVPKELEELNERLLDCRKCCHVEDLIKRKKEIAEELGISDVWNDVDKATDLSREDSEISDLLNEYFGTKKKLDEAIAACELAEEDESFISSFLVYKEELEHAIAQLEIQSWFTGKFDKSNAIMSINPGQGGLEAQDWTEMLFRMYCHYAEKKNWKVRVLDSVRGERIGMDRVVMEISGKNAYGMLRSEIGVHRLVRISPTDIKKRRHTTFASVEVLPVLPDDIEIELDMNDVRVDVYRSSGPGGQCVNTTDSAVRLTHIPTGIVVTCQNEKSQLLNKEAAISVLKSRLYELEKNKRDKELDELRGEKNDSSFGSQIRNYILYPFQLVKDTRTNIETSNTSGVLNGDIDDFVIGYHKYCAM